MLSFNLVQSSKFWECSNSLILQGKFNATMRYSISLNTLTTRLLISGFQVQVLHGAIVTAVVGLRGNAGGTKGATSRPFGRVAT
jgi:hypothetical protein